MKQTLLIIAALLCMTGSHVSAQDIGKPWSMQIGAGYSETDNVPGSFTYGFYLGHRIGSVLEVGISMYNATRQSSRDTYSYASNENEGTLNVTVTPDNNETWTFFDSGSANCYMAVVGFSPMRMLFHNSDHDLVIAAQVGLSNKHNIRFAYLNQESNVNIYTNSMTRLGYGARVAYQYYLSKTIGAGATAIYDNGNKMLTAMATLTARF